MTPKQIDREIARELAAAAAHRRKADEAEMRVRLLEELRRLHSAHSESTISDMQPETAQSPLGVRIAAGRAGQSDSRKAQILAKLTDADVAELTGYNRSTVCKWHNGSMKVPEEARKLLVKRGIPALSWSKR